MMNSGFLPQNLGDKPPSNDQGGPKITAIRPPPLGHPDASTRGGRGDKVVLMAMLQPAAEISFTEYVAREQESETKHEHVQGKIYAMAGGSPEHSLIAMNIGAELRAALRGKACRAYSSDLRIRIPATGLATYPDVTIICGTLMHDPEDRNTAINPSVIVEVLSPSTAGYDMGLKFEHYRQLPTLREYLLVLQDKPHVMHYARNEDGSWTLRDVRPPNDVKIATLGAKLSLREIYRDVIQLEAS